MYKPFFLCGKEGAQIYMFLIIHLTSTIVYRTQSNAACSRIREGHTQATHESSDLFQHPADQGPPTKSSSDTDLSETRQLKQP